MVQYVKYFDNGKRKLTVTAKLHYIKGNRAPYFSITGQIDRVLRQRVEGRIYEALREEAGGCLHEEIAEHFPELKPLIRLHLSDMDGTPIHALENGYFWLAGANGGWGERYHGSNGYTPQTPAACKRIAIDHLRISEHEYEFLVDHLRTAPTRAARIDHLKSVIDLVLKERWAKEAADAINTFGLRVEGDAWAAAVAAEGNVA